MKDNRTNVMESSRTRREYERRICMAMNHIADNLQRNISLDEVAEIAHFSKFHFHRLFSALVGETVADFTRRLRLERAARMLVFDAAKSVTAIALECGFSSSQNFAKVFKKHFDCAPRDYRQGYPLRSKPDTALTELSKIGHMDNNNGNVIQWPRDNNQGSTYLSERSLTMQVSVKEIAAQHVAYVRRIGAYGPEIGPLFDRICCWAAPRGLLNPQSQDHKSIGIYWDNPEVTPADKCRSDACLVVPEGTEVEGEIGLQTIPGGLFAFYRVEITPDGFPQAWDDFVGGWLPDSGYQPDERPCYEFYYDTPHSHPEGKFVLDLCLAIKPL